MLKDLKIACLKADMTLTEFARRIGRSATTVRHVADGRATSKYITERINELIQSDINYPPNGSKNYTPTSSPIVSHSQWYSTSEFAKLAKMRPESVANNCKAGRYIRAKRDGKKWLIHSSELEGKL